MLEYLYCYIATLLSQIAAIYLFGKLCSKTININSKYILIILFASVIQVILNISENALLGTTFTIVYFYIMFIKLYKCKRIESQNYSIIIWTISLLLDMMVMATVNISGLIKYYENNILLSKVVGSLVMTVMLFLLANIPIVTRDLNKIFKKMSKLKITMNHITIIVIAFLFLGFLSSENMGDKFVVTILLVTGISILTIVITFISMKYKLLILNKTNEILEKNDIINRRIITQYRILKHNLESQLLGVKTVSNKKAKELIDDLIKEYNSSFYIKHDINGMPTGINGLVFEKLYKYHEENLEITISNKIDSNVLNVLGPRNYNIFCEALGVTIDNALEAATKTKEKLIYLEFKESKEKIILKIMNTFSGNVELDKLGTVNYTSKEKGHGFGLFSLLGRKNLTITTNIKNDMFINLIEIKKKMKSEK